MMAFRAAKLSLLACVLLASCSLSEGPEKLPDLRLPTVSAQEGPSLASCPKRKCLTVYLAPWCGYCRQATPRLIELSRYLAQNGVETRFVVGKDSLSALRDYARVFGPDAMLDVDDVLSVGGVPHFFVTEAGGAVLKDVSGVPTGDYSMEEFAAFFGLP